MRTSVVLGVVLLLLLGADKHAPSEESTGSRLKGYITNGLNEFCLSFLYQRV